MSGYILDLTREDSIVSIEKEVLRLILQTHSGWNTGTCLKITLVAGTLTIVPLSPMDTQIINDIESLVTFELDDGFYISDTSWYENKSHRVHFEFNNGRLTFLTSSELLAKLTGQSEHIGETKLDVCCEGCQSLSIRVAELVKIFKPTLGAVPQTAEAVFIACLEKLIASGSVGTR